MVALPDSAALGSLEVTDTEGAARRLGEFWQEAPALLVFLRHYG